MESKATVGDLDLSMHIIPPADEMEALSLLSNQIHNEMDSLSPSTEEWCLLAERFIRLQRRMNYLEKN